MLSLPLPLGSWTWHHHEEPSYITPYNCAEEDLSIAFPSQETHLLLAIYNHKSSVSKREQTLF